MDIAFGPVPSRRLGQSLGINNIPPKACSYSCVYCQLGPTKRETVERSAFYSPDAVADAVAARVAALRARGQTIDYLTFVPDGEPTLDINLGQVIALLRPLGLPIAVITNGSLIDRDDVRRDLALADLVSLEVDTVDAAIWQVLNRPHPDLVLDRILDGMLIFAGSYQGRLITEAMLVPGLNDGEGALAAVAAFIARLRPAVACIGWATRPPAEAWVGRPDEATLVRAYDTFIRAGVAVELLPTAAAGGFGHTGDARADLLATTAVHPMSEAEVRDLLSRDGADWSVITALLDDGSLREIEHAGRRFFLRTLAQTGEPAATA